MIERSYAMPWLARLTSTGYGRGHRRRSRDFLMRSSSGIVLAQIDDLTRESQPVNNPAASDYPNWKRSLSITLEDLPAQSLLSRVAR